MTPGPRWAPAPTSAPTSTPTSTPAPAPAAPAALAPGAWTVIPPSSSAQWRAPLTTFCHMSVRLLTPVSTTLPVRFTISLVGEVWTQAPSSSWPAVVIIVAGPFPPLQILTKGGACPIWRQVDVSISFPKFIVGVSEHVKKVAVFSSWTLLYFK